jgi:hypothetical protein
MTIDEPRQGREGLRIAPATHRRNPIPFAVRTSKLLAPAKIALTKTATELISVDQQSAAVWPDHGSDFLRHGSKLAVLSTRPRKLALRRTHHGTPNT